MPFYLSLAHIRVRLTQLGFVIPTLAVAILVAALVALGVLDRQDETIESKNTSVAIDHIGLHRVSAVKIRGLYIELGLVDKA